MPEKRHFGFDFLSPSKHSESVAKVFTTAVHHYDLLNDVMSLGTHRIWKKIFINRAKVQSGELWLDLACGSGDITKMLLVQGAEVTAADANINMLNSAKNKLGNAKNLKFLECFAEEIPLPDNVFDGVTCAFGLRNFSNPQLAIAEMARIIKPGGRLVVLEFSQPHGLIAKFHRQYLLEALPAFGKAIADDEESYRYLGESILTHPNQEEVATWFREANLSEVTWLNLNLGIVAIHRGWKLL